jgi:hypothetical protein
MLGGKDRIVPEYRVPAVAIGGEDLGHIKALKDDSDRIWKTDFD